MANPEISCCLSLLCLLIMHSMFPCMYTFSEYPKSSKNCVESEKAALLAFKSSLSDPGNILSSWKRDDEYCCSWWGVSCNNKTNRVVGLNLGRSFEDLYDNDRWLGGEIHPSLLALKHLRHLDLSYNNFSWTSIPKFIGSLEKLRYLDLFEAGFVGLVPPELGNLSHLHYLNLNAFYQDYQQSIKLHVDDLPSLKYLDMSYVNLTAVADWLQMVNMLPSLTSLYLHKCGLQFIPISLSYINFTSLNTLDLSSNKINSTLPEWLWNISGLINLNLEKNSYHGPIPDAIGNLGSVESLQLDDNSFDGAIPRTVRNLCSLNMLDLSHNNISGDIGDLVEKPWNCTQHVLQYLYLSFNKLSGKVRRGVEQMVTLSELDLSNNQLDGPIPVAIGNLSQLTYLDLGSCSFTGVISEAHFANLTKLQSLILAMNSLTISVSQSWVPSFQLGSIALGSCQMGPYFPSWLRHQMQISSLDLSNCGISGRVPDWFWPENSPLINYLDLSDNSISGKLPESLKFSQYSKIILSSNLLEGSLPSGLLRNVDSLDLSNNSFSGPLPRVEVLNLEILHLSDNLFNSSIPSSLCQVVFSLDLSNNDLTGEIPDECFTSLLLYLNLANNRLSGRIPSSTGFATSLKALSLSNNVLSGSFPMSLQACRDLFILDFSENNFSGNIPRWLGENLTSLAFLSLRSNKFSGKIPPQLVQLRKLQVLDLADNCLSGSIPRSLGNFSAMTLVGEQNNVPDSSDVYYMDATSQIFTDTNYFSDYISLLVPTKGELLEYTKNRYLMKSIDLSDNYLRGDIPEEIVALSGLVNLNMSRNQLQGKIPWNIGRMHSLESLDLSRNKLSSSIPLSLASLNYLSILNLSYNNLSGKIPTGNQLRTLLDPSSYVGNIDLCGPPLAKNCSGNNTNDGGNRWDDDKDDNEVVWIYYGIGPGYVAGFWVVCGVLLFKKTWRYAYFGFFDDVYDWLYVAVFLTLAKLKRNRVVE